MLIERLVRDRAPEQMPYSKFRIASDGERDGLLRRALLERVDTYVAGGQIVDLVEVLDVVYELAEQAGVSREALDANRRARRLNKGGFERGYVLVLRRQ